MSSDEGNGQKKDSSSNLPDLQKIPEAEEKSEDVSKTKSQDAAKQ